MEEEEEEERDFEGEGLTSAAPVAGTRLSGLLP